MKTFLALAVVVLSVVSYFVLSGNFGIYQRFPWPHFLGIALGVFGLLRLMAEKRNIWRALATTLGLALGGLFFWYTLSYSNYAPRTVGVQAGSQVAALSGMQLTAHDGQPRNVIVDGDQATLLVLYRGYW